MPLLEIRDAESARRHILAGLWLSRINSPDVLTTPSVLAWLLTLASDGHAVPPVGFVADVGSLIFGASDVQPLPARELASVEPGLVRRYEDYCLGKLYSDLAFERGSDALQRYPAEDRGRGLAYLIERMLLQTEFAGVVINPAAIRGLQQIPPDEVLRHAWQTLAEDGLAPEAAGQYDDLIAGVKNAGDLLAPADILELERGTALAEFGQRLALRQVLRAADLLAAGLPRQRPRHASTRRQVATHLFTEDAYPVGGFSSISTKGTIESLLHSQLAYLERDERPDLFDIKFVRDELLYYSRDENQFLRRRTTLLVVLAPDLAAARIKDADLPYQRIILALGLVLALAERLRAWLSDEALELHLVFPTRPGDSPLEDERSLLELLLADQLEHGAARVDSVPEEQLPRIIAAHARKSLVRCVIAATTETSLPLEGVVPLRLLIAAANPHLEEPSRAPFWSEAPGLAAWRDVLGVLIERLL